MDIKGIIKEQREELNAIEHIERIIPRERLAEAEKALNYPNILAVLGIRRCGKSIFSYQLAKNRKMGYINFDDERLIELKTEDLDKILSAFYELYGDIDYIILDEIQNINSWELFVNRLRRTKKVILTGSNSRLLAGELSTHLTGRYIDIKLFPFSFMEFLQKKDYKQVKVYTAKEKTFILTLLNEYLQIGGFPETHKFGKAILFRIFEDIITKDIVMRHKIVKIEDLRKLANYLVSNSSQEATYSKLAKILGVKQVSTISKWIRYIEDSFLIIKVERFDFKLKQQYIAPKKIYSIDTGLINAVSFQFSENKGRLMENIVAIELCRRKAEEGVYDIYYWKDHQQNEVDFVVKNQRAVKELIQVTYASGKEDIKEREIMSLKKASQALRCSNMTIITWDYETTEGKVQFLPLWKWLLNSP